MKIKQKQGEANSIPQEDTHISIKLAEVKEGIMKCLKEILLKNNLINSY